MDRWRRLTRRRSWLFWTAIAVAAAIVLGFIGAHRAGGGSAADFSIALYGTPSSGQADQVTVNDLLKKGKPVVLNFWAGLCPPCRQEMPGIQRVYNDLGNRFTLLGVDVGPFMGLGSHSDARTFLKQEQITYPTGYALTADAITEYHISAMPTTVFILPNGHIFAEHTGFLAESAMRNSVLDLLAASQASGS